MPTVAGKVMEKNSDLFIVQWESQVKHYKKSNLRRLSLLIFVTVGSRPYPFDRLFTKLDELFEQGVIRDEIYAQIGTTKYKPKYFEYKDFYYSEKSFKKRI